MTRSARWFLLGTVCFSLAQGRALAGSLSSCSCSGTLCIFPDVGGGSHTGPCPCACAGATGGGPAKGGGGGSTMVNPIGLVTDSGQWAYCGPNATTCTPGTVYLDCAHVNSRNYLWASQ